MIIQWRKECDYISQDYAQEWNHILDICKYRQIFIYVGLYVNIYIYSITYICNSIFFFLTEAQWCFQCLLIDALAFLCCQMPLAESALSQVQPGLGSFLSSFSQNWTTRYSPRKHALLKQTLAGRWKQIAGFSPSFMLQTMPGLCSGVCCTRGGGDASCWFKKCLRGPNLCSTNVFIVASVECPNTPLTCNVPCCPAHWNAFVAVLILLWVFSLIYLITYFSLFFSSFSFLML